MSTQEKRKRFAEVAFRDLLRCYDHSFQMESIEKVIEDRSGKCFKDLSSSVPNDSTIERFEVSIAFEGYCWRRKGKEGKGIHEGTIAPPFSCKGDNKGESTILNQK